MKKNKQQKSSKVTTRESERAATPDVNGAFGSSELRDREQRSVAFLNQLPGYAWMKDAEGRYVYANSALQKLEAYHDNWLGKTDAELWPKEIADYYRQNDLRVIAERQPLETLEPYVLNGERRYVVVSKFPIMDAAGAVVMVGGASVDVTERERAAQKLQEYEKTVEGLEEMIAVVDRDYRYLLANRAFLDRRGLKREEVVGRFVWEVLEHEVFEQVVKHKLDECFTGKIVTYEVKHTYPKIGERDLFVSYFPIEGPEGINRVACVLQDITERKRAEEALGQSEHRLAEAQSVAHLGNWNWDIPTNTVTWSDELYRICGFQPRSFTPSYEAFLALVHPEDRESVERAQANCLGHHEGFSFQQRIIRPDKEVRVLQSFGNVECDDQGNPIRLFGACQDVTASVQAQHGRQEAERKYRDIFENAGEGIFRSTPEGRYLVANPALAAMYGYESPEDLMSNCNDISKQIYVNSSRREDFIRLMATKDAVRGFEAQVFRKDGSRFWVMVNARTVRGEDGKILYYEGTSQDITERKRALLTSAAFATLARRLSGARTNFDAAQIIAETAEHLFGWDACNLDLYDAQTDLVYLLLNIHTIDGKQVTVAPLTASRKPTARSRRVLQHGPELISRPVPVTFDADSVPFGDTDHPSASIMTVPIKHGTEIVGLLSIQSYTINAYDQAALKGLAALAEHCGEAINRIRAEDSFRESEERYRELFENSRDAIYVHDLTGRYISVNRAAEELTGFTRAEILGKHYSNFLAPKHLRDARESFCLKLDAPVETTYEAEVVCKNGQRKPVEINSRLIFKDGVAIGVQGTARDITERKRAQETLQTYARRLIEAQEAERQNVARELHDEIGQILTAVKFSLHAIEKSCQIDSALPRVAEGIEVVDDALARIRELSLELRPSLLDDLGLAAALRWYVGRYSGRNGIAAEVVGDSDIGRIPHEIETACFRITQEALTNIARHARATSATVQLERKNGHLYLTIGDNGVGFDPEVLLNMPSSMALGLHGMYERAAAVRGKIKINSIPGNGTQVIINVPLK